MNVKMSLEKASLPLAQLDWDLIRAFLAVAEQGSLTAGAAILGVSQPTLSRQISELEMTIGASLFERVPRGFSLTIAGSALLEPARQMQSAARMLSMRALGQTLLVAGTVRITASEMTASYLLPAILAGLRQQHPEIEIELSVSNEVENLLERCADIAVRHVKPIQTSLIARHLGDMKLDAFAHHNYVQRIGGSVDLNQIDRYDWIGYDKSDLLLRHFREAGKPVSREFFTFRCDNQSVGWQMALAELGIAFAPACIAQRWPMMLAVLPAELAPSMPVWMTTHRELRDSARIQLVFDWLANGLKKIIEAP